MIPIRARHFRCHDGDALPIALDDLNPLALWADHVTALAEGTERKILQYPAHASWLPRVPIICVCLHSVANGPVAPGFVLRQRHHKLLVDGKVRLRDEM